MEVLLSYFCILFSIENKNCFSYWAFEFLEFSLPLHFLLYLGTNQLDNY